MKAEEKTPEEVWIEKCEKRQKTLRLLLKSPNLVGSSGPENLSERSRSGVCEGCGNVDIRESMDGALETREENKDLRLVVVEKSTWSPFFMCLECLEDEITEHSEMIVHF